MHHCFPNGGGPVPFSVISNLVKDRLFSAPIESGEWPLVRDTARFARCAATLLLPIVLAACAGGEDSRSITYTDDRGVSNQPFPKNYRPEILAFMRTYLNNPAGVREAFMAEPVERTVGGRLRFISCLRYTPRESDGSYRDPRERGLLFVDGRLDRVVENSAEPCAGATYQPFPEMEKMTR